MTENFAAVVDRFWSKVRKSDGCWEWQAGRDRFGYGRFGIPSRRTILAHRFSYQLAHLVNLTAGQCVLHRCDNPRCVNPDHLWIGSRQDNMADKMAKGRQRNRIPPTHCPHGHSYAEHGRTRPTGGRECLECRRAYSREYGKRPANHMRILSRQRDRRRKERLERAATAVSGGK